MGRAALRPSLLVPLRGSKSLPLASRLSAEASAFDASQERLRAEEDALSCVIVPSVGVEAFREDFRTKSPGARFNAGAAESLPAMPCHGAAFCNSALPACARLKQAMK